MAELAPFRRIDDTRRWLVPNVASMAFDPSNDRLLVATRRDVRALDLETGREVLRFEAAAGPSSEMQLQVRVGARRAVALVEGEIVAWDTTTGRIVSRAQTDPLGTLDSLSDDASLLAMTIPTGDVPPVTLFAPPSRLMIVEVATGRRVRELPDLLPALYRSTILENDGRVLVCDRAGTLRELDATGALVREHAPLPLEPDPQAGIPYAGDAMRTTHELVPLTGSAVLVRSMEQTLIRDRVTGARLWSTGPSMLESRIVSSDGKRIYRRSSLPQSIELIHDALTGEAKALSGYGMIEWNILAEHDGLIATADYSGNIRVRRPGVLPSLAFPLDRIPSQPESIAISADGATVVVGTIDCSVRLFSRDGVRALPGQSGSGVSAGFLEDGRLWTSSSDHHRVWSREGRIDVEEAFLGSTYTNPQTSHSGRFLHGVRDSSVTVRSTATGRLHRDRVLGATNLREGGALLDDGITYFSVTEQAIARWNLETGERTAEILPNRFQEETYGALLAAPEPSGARVLLHGARLTYLWEPDSDALTEVPRIHRITRARWLPGNRLLVIGQHDDDPAATTLADSRLHVIDLRRLARTDVLVGPPEPIRAFAANDDYVAAVTEERTVCVWRLGAAG